MKIPLKNSMKYPCQINTRCTRELLEKTYRAKQLGVDVSEVQRHAIEQAIDKVLKELSSKAS